MKEADLSKIINAPVVYKQKGRTKYALIKDISTGDTEVSTIPAVIDGKDAGYGLLYIWCVYVAGYFVYGRTVDEFHDFCLYLYKNANINYKRRLVMYLHNLEYDWQFLQAAFNKPEIFATDKRAVLYAYAYGIEFRCSYKLTNMSLDKFTSSMNVLHHKQSGDDFDYHKIRTPDTVIGSSDFTIKNMYYCYCDVVGLYEAIVAKMSHDNDNVATIPLTSTGYVRREARNAMIKNDNNRKIFEKCALNEDTYRLCREAFRGGNTHANRNISGKILKNVASYDISSSYPSVILYEKYPVTAPVRIAIRDENDLTRLINSDYWLLLDVSFDNISTEAPIPYIPVDKCKEFSHLSVSDNGRVLQSEHIRLTMLKEDLIIVLSQYSFSNMQINDCYYSKTDYLPKELRQVTAEFFKGKTELKNVEGQEYYYGKLKNLLNAIFGMCVQDPVHSGIKCDRGIWTETQADIGTSLEHFYKSLNSFLTYQWGVTITAKARLRLQEAIDICGNNIAYVDTDSVKFIYSERIAKEIEKINDRIRKKAENSDVECIATTKDGEVQIMGLWDNETYKYEGHTYSKFRTYGAKKYAVEYYKKGERKFEITVAGLNKKKGAKEFGCIENFMLGVTIQNSGRTRAVYDDNIEPHTVTVNGKDYTIYTNVAILDTTYTLGVTDEYMNVAPNIIEGVLTA
jgi:hypothetical protein